VAVASAGPYANPHLLVLAHPGCPGQSPESRKMVVVVVVVAKVYSEEGEVATLSSDVPDINFLWR